MSAKPSLWARYRTLTICFGTTHRSFKELVTSPWLLVSPLAVLSFNEGSLSYSVLMKELSLQHATKAYNTLQDLIALETNPEFGVSARLTRRRRKTVTQTKVAEASWKRRDNRIYSSGKFCSEVPSSWDEYDTLCGKCKQIESMIRSTRKKQHWVCCYL